MSTIVGTRSGKGQKVVGCQRCFVAVQFDFEVAVGGMKRQTHQEEQGDRKIAVNKGTRAAFLSTPSKSLNFEAE